MMDKPSLIIEFRRELLKGLSNIQTDSFLTKKEVESLINISYGNAKNTIENAETEGDFIEDVE